MTDTHHETVNSNAPARVPVDLDELAGSVRANPGLHAKSSIALVGEVLGGTDWVSGPGDDGAVVPLADHQVIACGEALFPEFVRRDPHGAGIAAVLTNVNDLAAMGAEPLGIVNTVVASQAVARQALTGMRYAAELFDVPIIGGHLTVHSGEPAVSAFGIGSAPKVLSSTNARAGHSLVVAAALDGEMRTDFPYFRAFQARGPRCAQDVRLLSRLAQDGVVVAAKDISMAGLVGSLAMLLEPGGHGVTVDVDAVPVPAGVPLVRWLNCFPSFGFLLCTEPGRDVECVAAFAAHDLAAAVVGTLDDTGEIALRHQDHRTCVLRLADSAVTGLGR